MRWLIIFYNAKDEDLKSFESFFNKQDECTLSKFNLEEFEFARLKELKDLARETTHCIFLNTDKYSGSSEFIYLMGLFTGRSIPVYLNGGTGSAGKYSFADDGMESFVSCFETAGDLLSAISEDFEELQRVYKKKVAFNTLMNMGISFTPTNFGYYIEKDKPEICSLFYSAGMDVNSFTDDGVPLLCVACRNDNMEQLQWLLSHGADINIISKDRGYTPVMDAVWRKNLKMVDILIKKGANLNVMSSDGQSILVLAVGNGNSLIVKLLLENGADPDVKDSMGMSARGYAKLFRNEELMKLMETVPEKQ